MRQYRTPMPVNVDAYQAAHFQLIPPGMHDFQCSQGTFRKPLHYGGDERADLRLLSAGIRPYVETSLLDPVTKADVEDSDEFYSTFHATNSPPFYKPYPYPREMFLRVVEKYGGIIPVVVMAQLDGQAHYVGEPHVQVFCDEPGMGELVGWIESELLPPTWASSIVATRGRIRKDAWIDFFTKYYRGKTREAIAKMIAYKFHDFGRRGGAASQITGLAHLMNWLGTDTCDAAFIAQMKYNGRKPFGASSIVAAAHRTVTPWPTEDDSIANAIQKFGDGFLAFVADSYDYSRCLEKLAGYAKVIRTKGGFLVGRPDSGDVVSTIIEGLRVFERGFGLDEPGTVEAGGLRVIKQAGILQGDGVSDTILFQKIMPSVVAAGYSPINVGIGMGEYNHRAVRSDTEDGYKTNLVATAGYIYPDYRIYEDGYAMTMKGGSANLWKRSIPCPVGLHFDEADLGSYTNRVYPISVQELKDGMAGNMVVVFDGRPGVENRTPNWEMWTGTMSRAWDSWEKLPPCPPCDTFDPRIREMQERYLKGVAAR